MSAKKVIIDVDTGIDDALGLLLAIRSPELDVVGITTSFGATSVAQATENTLGILELLEQAREIPVARGAARPLKKEWDGPVANIHGENGVGEYRLPESDCNAIEMDAADFMIQMAERYKGELVFVCTARLTNLAIALERNPELKMWIKEVVVMGGAIRVPGNVTPYAEANIHGDPDAAKIVFESGLPITLVGLDVTEKVRLQEHELLKVGEAISRVGKEIDRFAIQILSYYIRAYQVELGIEGCMLHDPLAVAVCIDRSLVRSERVSVSVDVSDKDRIGQTRENPFSKHACLDVCFSVDEERAVQMFVNCLFLGDLN